MCIRDRGSIEPVVITEEFVSRGKPLKKLCPQFHLSLQSGCGATLKRMNRRYTPVSYTHLDVYKRQILTMVSRGMDRILTLFEYPSIDASIMVSLR